MGAALLSWLVSRWLYMDPEELDCVLWALSVALKNQQLRYLGNKKHGCMVWACGLVVECFIGIHKTLGSHTSTKKAGMECAKEGAVEMRSWKCGLSFLHRGFGDIGSCSWLNRFLSVSLCCFSKRREGR